MQTAYLFTSIQSGAFMSYLIPSEFTKKMVDAGESKLKMATRDVLIRSYMAGAILTLAVAFAVTAAVQTGLPIVGALVYWALIC
jgi:formate/nitrite transporter FocA (FNT family)